MLTEQQITFLAQPQARCTELAEIHTPPAAEDPGPVLTPDQQRAAAQDKRWTADLADELLWRVIRERRRLAALTGEETRP